MKNVKRFLALLLAVLMVSGNIISAVAAEVDGADVAEESVAVEATADTADTAEADNDTSDTLYNNTEEPAADEQVGEADKSAEAEEAAADVASVTADFDSLEVVSVTAANAVEDESADIEEESSETELVRMNDYTYGQETSKVVCNADGWTVTDVKYATRGDEGTASEDAPTQAGEYVATVTVKNESGESKVVSLNFNVLPAVITVTVEDWIITYGENDPDVSDLFVSIEGVVASDEVNVPYTVTLEPYGEYDEDEQFIAEQRPAGEYPIVVSSENVLDSKNYTIKYVDGTLNVSSKRIETGNYNFQATYDYTQGEVLVSEDTLAYGRDYLYTDDGNGTVIITGVGNYTGEATATYTKDKTSMADCTVTLDIPEDGYVYDGKAHEPTVVVTDAAGNTLDESCYTVTYFANISAGIGEVHVDGVEEQSYAGRKTVNFTIKPCPITIEIDAITIQYGEAAEHLTYTITDGELVGSDTLYCVPTTDYKAGDSVGSYDITATLLADVLDDEGNVIDSYNPNSNYAIAVIPGKLTVDPAGRNFSVNGYSGTYDGQQHPITFNGDILESDTITYLVDGIETEDTPSIKNAGIKNVEVRIKNSNYEGMDGEGAIYSATLKVTPAEITVTTEGAEKVYDGTPLIPGTTTITFGGRTVSFTGNSGTEIGLIGNDQGIISVTGSQTEVGSATTSCSLDEVQNGSADNYTINYTPGTLTVKDYMVVSVANAAELETETIYDGKEHKWVPELTADGEALPTSAYEVDYSSTNSKKLTTPGDITVTITLRDYGYTFKAGEEIRTATYMYTIQKRPLPFAPVLKDGVTGYSLSGDAENGYVISREYDENPLDVEDYLGVEIKGLNAGESAPYTVKFSEPAADGRIAYTVNRRVVGDSLLNYEIPDITISLRTEPRNIAGENSGVTAALEYETAVYNGQAHEPKVTVTYGKRTLEEGTDYTVSYADNVNAGTGKAVITGTGNFTGTLTETFKIDQAALAIRPDSAQFVYNGEVQVPGGKIVYDNEEIEFTYANPIRVELPTGDTVILTRPNYLDPVYANEKNEYYSNRYNYAIVTGEDDSDVSGNYAVVNETAQFTIIKAEFNEVTVKLEDTEYGTPLVYSMVNSDGTDVELKATYHFENADGEPIEEPQNVGTYKVYATWDGTESYTEGETAAVEFKITPKPVTVTANNATKTYGDDDDLTYTVNADELAYNDDASVISATVRRAEGENVGIYAITVSGDAEQGNYTVTYENGSEATLTITPKPITVRPKTVKLAYGDAVPTEWNLALEILNGALVGNDTLRYDSVTTNYTSDSEPGSYTLAVGAAAELNPNYDVKWEAGTITVNDGRDIEISGQGTYTYDGNSHDFLVDGLMAGDTVTYNLLGQEPQTLTIGEGDATTLIIAGITDAGTVTLEKIVISNPEYRDYGGENLAVTVNPAGLNVTRPENLEYNGTEQQQAVTVTANGTMPVEGTDYDVTYSEDMTSAGTVTVTVTGKGNYTGTYDASYQITPKPLTVIVPSLTKVYDGEPLTATAYIEEGGLVGDDNAAVSVYNSETYAGEITDAGTLTLDTYSILWETGDDNNYSVTLRQGTLTVERRAMANVAVSGAPAYTYDGTAHQWSPVVSIAGGMTLTERTDYYVTYSTDDLQDAGSITVTINGLGNFEGATSATYTIRPATLTVTTASASKTYDGTALTAGGSISGLAAGDTVTFSVTGRQMEVGSSQNTYSLVWNGTASAANYYVTANLGTLTVNPVPVLTETDNPADGEDPADGEEPADGEDLTSIEENETPLSEAPAGDYSLTEDGTITTLEEDETPLAGSPLEDADCIMHFLLLIAALAVAAYYGYTRKKHQELEKKLQDEIAKV